MELKIVSGSVVFADVDVVVNAANKYLSKGGGLCGAIFEEAGMDKLAKECSAIGGCETGSAVITNGYNLKAKKIIHAVGPDYYADTDCPAKLKSAYQKSLELADKNGLQSIAFPSISTGIFGYPLEEASNIAVSTILNFKPNNLKVCYLYCYKEEEFIHYSQALANLLK